MSRIGRQQITIPEKTEVNISDGTVTVKGPLGEISREFKPEVGIEVKDREVILKPASEQDKSSGALWGTYASHISNMIHGVNEKYEKKLVLEGVGYKVEISGENLVMQLGFSHPVSIRIPEGLSVNVEKNVITVSGIDKELVGQFSAKVRAQKKPEPYKGKGIRYENEVVRRKQGKKAV